MVNAPSEHLRFHYLHAPEDAGDGVIAASSRSEITSRRLRPRPNDTTYHRPDFSCHARRLGSSNPARRWCGLRAADQDARLIGDD
jgi:hypothetical protein